MAVRDLTAARLRELLDYNPETGLFIWKTSRHGVFAGAIAGWTNQSGYVNVSIDGATHQTHRLAWLHFHGCWPKQYIDHINGVRHDNRISNLRDVAPRVNSENMRRPMPTNRCGVMGVRKGRTPGKWEAWITIQGRNKYVGVFTTVEEAHAAYLTTKRLLHEGCTI